MERRTGVRPPPVQHAKQPFRNVGLCAQYYIYSVLHVVLCTMNVSHQVQHAIVTLAFVKKNTRAVARLCTKTLAWILEWKFEL